VLLPVLWMMVELTRDRFDSWSNQVERQPEDREGIILRVERCAQLAFTLFISLELLNAGYLFERSLEPLGEFQFVSEALSGRPAGEVGNRFTSSWLGSLPVPVPRSYMTGLDLQRRDFEGNWKPLVSYLGGKLREGGWWYYYLYGLGVKVPLGVGLLGLVTLVASCRRGMALRSISWQDRLVLLLPPLALFTFISSQTGFSRYFRYALPCFPFVFIALGSIWSIRGVSVGRRLQALSAVCLLMMIGASLSVYPHSLEFFNVLAGGPEQGHWHLLDSNLDWGQDLYSLKAWQRRHPEARPLTVAYSGVADPALFGLRPAADPDPSAKSLPPGWYAVSANRLHGYDDPDARWTRFLSMKPVGRAGYSILIYRITAEAQ